MKIYENVRLAFCDSLVNLSRLGQIVENPIWQGVDTKSNPSANEMFELLNLSFQAKMPDSKKELTKLLQFPGNIPPVDGWAEEHFQERVSGIPYNPPPSFIRWQNGTSGDYMMGQDKLFSHTYPERFWIDKIQPSGIRFKNGNLNSIVKILRANPNSRQAFLPMVLPEDLTASEQNERIPCSLGWHFIQRKGYLHLFYSLRSCDALRHFVNDLYMAVRLAQWVRDRAFTGGEGGMKVELGLITFVAVSFHCFKNDQFALNNLITKSFSPGGSTKK